MQAAREREREREREENAWMWSSHSNDSVEKATHKVELKLDTGHVDSHTESSENKRERKRERVTKGGREREGMKVSCGQNTMEHGLNVISVSRTSGGETYTMRERGE